MLLTAEGISKHFGSNAVLQNASLAISENQVAGLIGPNGSGKTTLFRVPGRAHSRGCW